jgi:hypothetical protein
MRIKAEAALNGKIILEILDVNDARLNVFLMPNDFSGKYGTLGILENNKITKDPKDGARFEVPTDW